MFINAVWRSAIFHVGKIRHYLTPEVTEQATSLSAADLMLEMHCSNN